MKPSFPLPSSLSLLRTTALAIASLLLLCLLSSLASAQHSSAILFQEDWSSHAEGPPDQTGSAWKFLWTDRGLIEVVENPSPFGKSQNALKIEHTDEISSWGPRAIGVFPSPVSEAITVSFDFLLDGKSTDQPTFTLGGGTDGSPGSGLFIALDNAGFPTSIRGRNVVNRSSGDLAEAICPVRLKQWYRVVLEIAKPAEGKFNIIVTPDGGDPVRVNGLSFRAPLLDYRELNFCTNAKGGSGILYVTNIQVSAAKK
jgi:hypothetical protein